MSSDFASSIDTTSIHPTLALSHAVHRLPAQLGSCVVHSFLTHGLSLANQHQLDIAFVFTNTRPFENTLLTQMTAFVSQTYQLGKQNKPIRHGDTVRFADRTHIGSYIHTQTAFALMTQETYKAYTASMPALPSQPRTSERLLCALLVTDGEADLIDNGGGITRFVTMNTLRCSRSQQNAPTASSPTTVCMSLLTIHSDLTRLRSLVPTSSESKTESKLEPPTSAPNKPTTPAVKLSKREQLQAKLRDKRKAAETQATAASLPTTKSNESELDQPKRIRSIADTFASHSVYASEVYLEDNKLTWSIPTSQRERVRTIVQDKWNDQGLLIRTSFPFVTEDGSAQAVWTAYEKAENNSDNMIFPTHIPSSASAPRRLYLSFIAFMHVRSGNDEGSLNEDGGLLMLTSESFNGVRQMLIQGKSVSIVADTAKGYNFDLMWHDHQQALANKAANTSALHNKKTETKIDSKDDDFLLESIYRHLPLYQSSGKITLLKIELGPVTSGDVASADVIADSNGHSDMKALSSSDRQRLRDRLKQSDLILYCQLISRLTERVLSEAIAAHPASLLSSSKSWHQDSESLRVSIQVNADRNGRVTVSRLSELFAECLLDHTVMNKLHVHITKVTPPRFNSAAIYEDANECWLQVNMYFKVNLK